MHTYTFDRYSGFRPAPEGHEAPIFTLTTDRELDDTTMGGIGTRTEAQTMLDMMENGDQQFTINLQQGDHVVLNGRSGDSALTFNGAGTISVDDGYQTVLSPIIVNDDIIVDHADNEGVCLRMYGRTRADVRNARNLELHDDAELRLDAPRPAKDANSVIVVNLNDKSHADITGNLEGLPATCVSLYDMSTTTFNGSGFVDLCDNSKGDLYGKAHINLRGTSHARVYGESRVNVADTAHADVLDDCIVRVRDHATASEGDTTMPGHHAPDRRSITFTDQASDPNHVLDVPVPTPTISDRIRAMVSNLHGSHTTQQQEAMTR